MKNILEEKIYGCLAGGLIGDAMGAPVENWHYSKIADTYGILEDFEGAGTDDSAIKLILCDALISNNGHITADELAAFFLKYEKDYYDLFYIPVKNMFHKIQDGLSLPVYAGMGNMQSSSSAMSISPMGIVNACNPRRAALETYDIAGLIHAGETTFCRDAACAMAAAVAEAMKINCTVDSILDASTAYLHKKSSHVMIECISESIEMAKKVKNYEQYRQWIYENKAKNVMCDSRETVPVALSLFYLADGDPCNSIIYGANFGRDADTIATMAGALAGAFKGVGALRPAWIEKLEKNNDQQSLIESLSRVTMNKIEEQREMILAFDGLLTEVL